jgi:hypothetical protein
MVFEGLYLVNDAVPGISAAECKHKQMRGCAQENSPSIVDNDMNLAIPELSSLLHESLEVFRV